MPVPIAEELRRRKIVGVNAETVTNVTSTDIPGHYPGEDHSWSLEQFQNNFHVQFHKNTPHLSVFSLIGLDASIANAIRRILLAELPTLAIEEVYIEQNTSIIQDEVLAHRLGLVPLRGDAVGLRWLRWRQAADSEAGIDADPSTDFNTVLLKLDIECTWQEKGKERAKKGESDPMLLYNNAHIYAESLEYNAIGQQAARYFKDDPIAPVHPKILLAKMRPGQRITASMHAILGVGGDHAKYSPVATASYRLLPVIDIVRPIVGADARKFARCFPKGVIGLEPVTAAEARKEGSGYEGQEGEVKAVVKDAMRDTVSRECLRHDEFKGKVKLGRQRDHFIFSVESTGQWESEEMVLDAVAVLRRKAARFGRMLEELRQYG